MSDIYDIMSEEARQSFFHLKNVTASLDAKAFGLISVDALLFTVFAYINNLPFSNRIFYIAPCLIIFSLVSLLIGAWPRNYKVLSSEEIIKEYGTLEPKFALSQLAANYAGLERELFKIYKNKSRWIYAGLILMVVSMITELIIFMYIIIHP